MALAAEPGADVETKVDVGRSLTAVAGLLSAAGKTDEAEATYRKAETLLADLARSSLRPRPRGPRWRTAGRGWGGFDTTPASSSTRWCRTAWRGTIRRRWPTPPAHRRRPGVTWRNDPSHRLAAEQTDKKSEAEAEYRKAIALWQKLADDYPAVTEFRSGLAVSLNNLGLLLNDSGRQSESEAEFRKAIALMQKLADDNPAVTEFRYGLAINRPNLAIPLPGKPSEAEAELRKAIALFQKLADDNPAVIDFRNGTGRQPHHPRFLLSGMGKPTEAEAEIRAAVTIFGRSWPTIIAPSPLRMSLAQPRPTCSLLSRRGKPTEAEAEFRRRSRSLGRSSTTTPRSCFHREVLAAVSREPRRVAPQARPTSRGP